MQHNTKYLIDVNLLYRFIHWHSDEYVHQRDIDSTFQDDKIWDYAKTNNLTIVTKDADFANRILLHTPPPRVIHFKVGNMKLKDFHLFVQNKWDKILIVSNQYKLVNVFVDRIEGID